MPGLEPDGKLIWTYREAMVPPSFPKSLLVVGSGAIGIEFASFYRTLGSDVTVVEVLDRVLPVEDEEISQFAHKAFAKQGMKIKVGLESQRLCFGVLDPCQYPVDGDPVTADLHQNAGFAEELRGHPYRDFTLLFQEQDAAIGTHRMPYTETVDGPVGWPGRPGSVSSMAAATRVRSSP